MVVSIYNPANNVGMLCSAYSLSHVWLFETRGLLPARLLCPWGFSRHEYWSGLPCPPPGDLPKPGIKSRSPALQVDSFQSESPGKPNSELTPGKKFLAGMPRFGCDFLPQSNTVHSFQNTILDQKCSESAETAAGSYLSGEAHKALLGSLKPCV